MRSPEKAVRLTLLFAVGWILLPLVLLALPLWDWPVPDWQRLTLVLLAFTMAFALGGSAGLALVEKLAAAAPARSPGGFVDAGVFPIRPIIALTILLNLGALVARVGFNPLTCGSLLECSNAAYQSYVEGSLTGAGAAFEYVRILFAPALYAGIAISIWQIVFREDRSLRPWAILTILTEVLLAIGTGTARNLANILIYWLFLRLLKMQFHQDEAKYTDKKWSFLIMAIVFVILFFFYFSFLQLNRDGLVAAVGLMPFNGDYIESWSFREGNENFIIKGIESVVRYLATGYFSFSLALGLPEARTFPLGSSMFLARRAALAGDDSYIVQSLPGQIESHYAWSYTEQWHSLFSWLLSDFSIFGVAAIMFGIGLMLSLSVWVALTRAGAFARMPFFILFLIVLYVPANNQIFQSPETAVSFFAAILILLAMLVPRRHHGLPGARPARRAA